MMRCFMDSCNVTSAIPSEASQSTLRTPIISAPTLALTTILISRIQKKKDWKHMEVFLTTGGMWWTLRKKHLASNVSAIISTTLMNKNTMSSQTSTHRNNSYHHFPKEFSKWSDKRCNQTQGLPQWSVSKKKSSWMRTQNWLPNMTTHSTELKLG